MPEELIEKVIAYNYAIVFDHDHYALYKWGDPHDVLRHPELESFVKLVGDYIDTYEG